MNIHSLNKWIMAFILPILLTSCNSDESVEEYKNTLESNIHGKSGILFSPSNSSNPYDSVGVLHNDILDIYLSGNHTHTSVEDIDNEVQSLIMASTIVSDSSALILPGIDVIADILNSPDTSLTNIIDSSDFTGYAKIQFADFVDSLMMMSNDEYEYIYDFIILYESSVLTDTSLISNDKRIILTVTSLARHSFYYSKKRKDKDWETSVGNIAAGTGGALEDPVAALRMALVTGLSKAIISP